MRRATILALLLVAWSAAITVVQTSAEQTERRTAASPTPRALLNRVLHRLSQPETSHRWTRARHTRRISTGRQCGYLGARDRQTSGALDAASRETKARCGGVSRRGDSARDRHRPGLGGTPESRQNRRRASAESHGVHQRRARPVRARVRCEAAPARRRDRRRQLRQPRRCPVDLDGSPRTVLVGGSSDQSPGHRPAAHEPAGRDLRDPAPRDPGRSTRRESPIRIRGGIAIPYTFPVDGEYTIQVRLQRQYQDYLKGMGWPQQLDIRLDGKLVKRFTVGGNAKGRPAALSYAGDGEPGFAGDPEWEKYMQLTGDAGLEVRIPVIAGPRVVSASFVRELWEPEGLPHPPQRGRTIANDNVYMGTRTWARSRSEGPTRRPDPHRTRQADARFSSASRRPAPRKVGARHGSSRGSPGAPIEGR